MDHEDLVGWGQFGLLSACELYQKGLGLKFSTYAGVAIRRAMRKAILGSVPFIRLPSHIVEKLSNPSSEKAQSSRSLQAAIKHRERVCARENSLAVPLSSLAVAPGDDQVARNEDAGVVDSLLQGLPEIEATVLRLRFGIGQEPKSNRQVAEIIGKSKSRVDQIQRNAIQRIRETKGIESRRAS